MRDPAYYSITDLEWPEVRTNLRSQLAAARARDSGRVQWPTKKG